jgi:tRNA nucleotidyltransferase/poly(A) polymerase
MTNQHPITPPLELQDKWRQDWYKSKVKHIQLEDHIATQAAQWGADQELDACCEWNSWRYSKTIADQLREARRAKPPSLKEQALKALHTSVDLDEFPKQYNTIRLALEALPND